mmetsp:Transcript_12403/g.34799  ORF Transcript_12403/g.34799 Transcript_12403/m.34799 type:complete len:221 (-) Transcript_12403:672-1334(-)
MLAASSKLPGDLELAKILTHEKLLPKLPRVSLSEAGHRLGDARHERGEHHQGHDDDNACEESLMDVDWHDLHGCGGKLREGPMHTRKVRVHIRIVRVEIPVPPRNGSVFPVGQPVPRAGHIVGHQNQDQQELRDACYYAQTFRVHRAQHLIERGVELRHPQEPHRPQTSRGRLANTKHPRAANADNEETPVADRDDEVWDKPCADVVLRHLVLAHLEQPL